MIFVRLAPPEKPQNTTIGNFVSMVSPYSTKIPLRLDGCFAAAFSEPSPMGGSEKLAELPRRRGRQRGKKSR